MLDTCRYELEVVELLSPSAAEETPVYESCGFASKVSVAPKVRLIDRTKARAGFQAAQANGKPLPLNGRGFGYSQERTG